MPEMPRPGRALLHRFCAPERLEEIEGDLCELFALRVRRQGYALAWLLFWKDLLLFVRPGMVRRAPSHPTARGPIMLKSYLLIALRNLRKYQLYSFINVFGLSVGMAVSILLLLFVQHEWSFDRFHTNEDRLYRLAVTYKGTNESYSSRAAFSPAVGPALAASFPGVEDAVRVWYSPGVIIRQEDDLFTEGVTLVDPGFFEAFSFPLLQGDPATALQDPGGLVLTQEAATRYFGTADPMGRVLTLQIHDALATFTVTGVVADPPTNSSIEYGLLMPYQRVPDFQGEGSLEDWDDSFTSIFVLLEPDTDGRAVTAKLPGFVQQYYGHWFEGFRERGIDGSDEDLIHYWLQPLADIRMNASVEALEPTSTPIFNYLLAGIALFILAIACINFVNLAIARASSRTKEIGIRKAVGAYRGQLMKQFWGEAILLSFAALAVGVGLAALALPLFNTLADKTLELNPGPSTLALWFGLALGVGLVAGGYPAVLLSGFNPVSMLRGRLAIDGRQRFGKALIVFQFMLSVALIVTAALVARQVDFLRSRSVGFDREHLVVIPSMTQEGDDAYRLFRQALAGEPGIEALTATSSPMSSFRSRRSVVIGGDNFQAATLRVDYNFIEVMGLSVLAGRDFSEAFPGDAAEAVIVNERFLRRVGWSAEEALGQTFTFYDERPATVVGVVQDFHLTSFHTPMEPTVLYVNPTRQVRFFLARIRATDIPATLATLEATWKSLFPDRPYSYSFLEDRLARQYAFEARISAIMRHAMFFATLIACLGLFGLAALSLTRRTREIGIRKVLGATVPGLVSLVSRQFLVLVLLANLLAWPLAYFATDALLQFHAYRIDITPLTFVVTGLLSLLLAFLTVSYQAIRAARTNPVESLRYE